MSSRGMEHSGGFLHVAMVKETVKRIVDRFNTMNRIMIQFEETITVGVRFEEDKYRKSFYAPSLHFRPDILLHHIVNRDESFREKRMNMDERQNLWEKIEDSDNVFFEVETDPRKIFRDGKLKLEFYKRMQKERRDGRTTWAFVLVVPQDSSLPADTKPFDEVWEIPTEDLEREARAKV